MIVTLFSIQDGAGNTQVTSVPDGAGDHMVKQLEGGQGSQGNFVVIKDEEEKKSETDNSQQDTDIDASAITQVHLKKILYLMLLLQNSC